MSKTGKKIIIFDDDEDILSICSYILEEQGWEVFTFTNCNNIVDRVAGILPDVILMDNWIPDDGGIMATQSLKMNEALKQSRSSTFLQTAIFNYLLTMRVPKLTWQNRLIWKILNRL